MSNHVSQIDDASFEQEVIKAELPVLVDFWAAWCGPCKMIAPIIEEVATDYLNKIKVVKMDVEQNQETPTRFGIHGIPTLILFKNGEEVATHVGALTKSQLTAFIDSNL